MRSSSIWPPCSPPDGYAGLLASTAAAIVAGLAAPAQAADSVSATPPRVAEIVVTAQRREQKAIDVPISLSAISGQTLKALGVQSPDKLATLVPGLTFSNTGPIPVFSIRGVTLNDYGLSNKSPIALYVDDVYYAAPSAVTGQMFDVSRVEVLRGPQGTLFGRNATGGLVQIISNKPTRNFEADASVQYGSFDQFIAQAAMGGPISDRLRIRAAFNYDRDNGWQKNVVTDERQAKTNVWGARIIADFDITQHLTSELNIHGGDQDNITPGYYNRGEFDPLSGAMCLTAQILSNLCVSPFGSRDPHPQPGVIYSDFLNPHNRTRTAGIDEILTYAGNGLTVTSITALEYSKKFYEEDSDGSPDPLIASDGGATRQQFSQELRANGRLGAARWLVGGFFFDERLTDGFASLLQIVPLYGTYGNQNQFFDRTRSGAVFGQVDYDILPNLTATGGARFTTETKRLTISDDFEDPTYVDYDAASTRRVTWKVGLAWRFQPGWITYGNISTGFKSPAFDTTLVLQGGAIAAKPETDINYEVGIKGESFDHRLEFTAAAFYLNYHNFQLVTIPQDGTGATSELLNADGARIYGADAEINATPLTGVTLNVSATLLHTRINSPGLFVGAFPVTGAQLAYSPKLSLKGFARYDWRVGALGVISPHVDFAYDSLSQSQPILNPLTTIPAHLIVNGGIQYLPHNGKIAIDVFVDNLTDRNYITYAGDFSGYNILQWAKPRTWGVRLSTKW